MKDEIFRDMVLMGCKSVSELNKSKVSFREKRY
jgi:isopentenyl diphosphate isomerase/L-lactate dehydrogenase-like FMN-dependent dehydrogenase